MKVLIVGQAPSRVMSPGDRPFAGTSALTRLAKYAGIEPRERFYDLANFINVVEHYPGPALGNPKYDGFPRESALLGMERVRAHIVDTRPDLVVGLGLRVAQCFGVKPVWFAQYVYSVDSVAVTFTPSPHPSGASHWWNDPAHRHAGRQFWMNLFDPSSLR